MRFTQYAMPITLPLPAAHGDVMVQFSASGDQVKFDDGAVAPREWLYIDNSGRPGSPVYIIECAIDENRVPRVMTVIAAAQAGGRELQVSDLRRLRPFEDILEESFARVAVRPSVVVDEPAPDVEPRDLLVEAAARRKTVRGIRREDRRRFTPEMAEEIAAVYVANAASGAPTKAVRKHFGIAESTASLYVKRARPLIDKLIEERRDGER